MLKYTICILNMDQPKLLKYSYKAWLTAKKTWLTVWKLYGKQNGSVVKWKTSLIGWVTAEATVNKTQVENSHTFILAMINWKVKRPEKCVKI